MTDIFYPVAHRPQEQIDVFRTRYDDFDSSLIPKIVKDSIGLDVLRVKKSSSWGSAHVIYFLEFENNDDLVFRANINMPSPENVMIVEKIITDLLIDRGFLTNKVVFVDATRKKYPFDFQIQEKLGGVDPEDEFSGTKEDYEAFTFQTGQVIARMSEITLDGFGRFDEFAALNGELRGNKSSLYDYLRVCLDEDLESLEKFKVISQKQTVKINDFFIQRKTIINISKGSLVHYDLADHNLRYGDGKLLGIFDWETAVVASPVLDLASCPTWKSHYPKRQKLIEGYTSIKNLPDDFEELEKVFLLRTMIWKMRYAIRAGILTDERKALFYDSLKNALRE